MNPYFSLSDKIYDITEKYPILIKWLAENGFTDIKNDNLRQTIGRLISMEDALNSKKLSVETFEKNMLAVLDADENTVNTNKRRLKDNNIRIDGVLPCPIRVQILEKLEEWGKNQKQTIEYELPAASMGVDWLREKINKSSFDELADVYISAGFSLLFDRNSLGKYIDNNTYSNLTTETKLNHAFTTDDANLYDPHRQYAIIGAIPAVFVVNTSILKDDIPRSWEELLDNKYANKIALPMQDMDLFNAVLLNIYQRFGKDGIIRLGKNFSASLHPAQAIKTGKRKNTQAPPIAIMPYFFTKMLDKNTTMQAIWPKEGAIISPIFLVAKNSAQKKVQHVVDFLFSKELGELFCMEGKFPSTHPEVDNKLSPQQKFLWPGWQFIHRHDISKLLTPLRSIFDQASEGSTK